MKSSIRQEVPKMRRSNEHGRIKWRGPERPCPPGGREVWIRLCMNNSKGGLIVNVNLHFSSFFEPTCANARWALIHHFASVHLWEKFRLLRNWLDNNSYLEKYCYTPVRSFISFYILLCTGPRHRRRCKVLGCFVQEKAGGLTLTSSCIFCNVFKWSEAWNEGIEFSLLKYVVTTVVILVALTGRIWMMNHCMKLHFEFIGQIYCLRWNFASKYCTVGSYTSLSVCLSVCLSVWTTPKIRLGKIISQK